MRRTARMVVLVVLLVLLALPASSPVASQPASIPFTTNPDGMIVVPARLGSTVPMQVIFDTGAGLDILAPSLVEKVHGKAAGQFTGFRMFGERIDIPLFVVSELSIGPLVRKNALVGSWDVLDKVRMDGIVSVGGFRSQPFTLDFPRRLMVFETPRSLSARRAGGAAIPLQVNDERGIALSLFAPFLVAGQPGLCEIDTGSPASTVNTRYMAALGIAADSNKVEKKSHRSVESGAVITRYWTTLPQLSLAGAARITLASPRVAFADIIYDCVVGVDFWRDRVLTIDTANRQLIAF